VTGRPNSFGWTGEDDRRVGGLISRTDEDSPELRAYYADRVQRLSLDDRLHMEGTVRLDRANSDSATLLGWFRAGSTGKGEAEAAPADFMGIAITGPSEIGQYFSALLSDSEGTVERADDELGFVLNPGPAVHRWSFDYYPHSGKAGVIVVRLDGRRVAWSVPAKLRHEGATFNRFGLRNLERGGSFQYVYFGELRYTFRGPGSLAPPTDRKGDDDDSRNDDDDSRGDDDDSRGDDDDSRGDDDSDGKDRDGSRDGRRSRKHDRSRKRDRG
jgi:hypothetical protein